MSVAPRGGNGITMRSGLVCAKLIPGMTVVDSSAVSTGRRRIRFTPCVRAMSEGRPSFDS